MNKFIAFFTLGFVFGTGMQNSSVAQSGDPVDMVNPFIGTDFFGHTFPGASLPFAMVHLSPDMNTQGWTFASGYAYSESSIMGFSHLHWSGVGMVNGGEIMLMPTAGDKLQVVPGPVDNPDAGYRSRFEHSGETASPGYYSVILKDYNIKAELTSTRRAGFHRYTFPESVPNTLELAYDDWCIATLAKELGRKDDYDLFIKRAFNYRNLWDGKTQFMRPKRSDGTWLEELNGHEQEIVKEGEHSWYKYFDPLLVGRRPSRHYTESNAWQYIWSVQHDVQGLINLFGGNKAFTAKLDTFFEMSPNITPPKYVGVVGTIGQYVHGNQPSHHVAYLYDYAGEPWKTQQRVRQICEQLYRAGPGGLCGNEDMGSLSSWYILSAMGFYAVTPGTTFYTIGSPSFGKVTIVTGKDKTFTIEALNNSPENKYIQSAILNSKPLTRTWITQKEITDGGVLIFRMGPEPDKSWGSRPEDAPSSMTGK